MPTPSPDPSPAECTLLLAGPFDGQSIAHLGGARVWALVDPRTGENYAAVGERALGCGAAELQRTHPGLDGLLQLQGVYRPIRGTPRAACFQDLAGPGDSARARQYRELAFFTVEWYRLTVLGARDVLPRERVIRRLLSSFPDDPVIAVMASEYNARLELLDE
jgi:hypothetical protein